MDSEKIIQDFIMWQLKHGYVTKMGMIKMTHHLKKEAKTNKKEALDKYAAAKETEKEQWIEEHKKICSHCKMDIEIRNPSGYCDHLYYPDNCEVCTELSEKVKEDE